MVESSFNEELDEGETEDDLRRFKVHTACEEWDQLEADRKAALETAAEVFECYYDMIAEMVEGTDIATRRIVRALFNDECDKQDEYQRTHPELFSEREE